MVAGDKVEIPTENGIAFELLIRIDLRGSTADSFALILRSDGTHQTMVSFDLKKQIMSVDRNVSDGWSSGKTKSPLIMADQNEMKVHAYIDQSSIEVFTDDYKTSHSCNVFAEDRQNMNYLIARGGEIKVKHMAAWAMEKVME